MSTFVSSSLSLYYGVYKLPLQKNHLNSLKKEIILLFCANLEFTGKLIFEYEQT